MHEWVQEWTHLPVQKKRTDNRSVKVVAREVNHIVNLLLYLQQVLNSNTSCKIKEFTLEVTRDHAFTHLFTLNVMI